jgi:hypothetical protein
VTLRRSSVSARPFAFFGAGFARERFGTAGATLPDPSTRHGALTTSDEFDVPEGVYELNGDLLTIGTDGVTGRWCYPVSKRQGIRS